MQDPRAVLRPPAGDGFSLPRAHAGRRGGDHRLARYRVWGDRPVRRIRTTAGRIPISAHKGQCAGTPAMSRNRIGVLKQIVRASNEIPGNGTVPDLPGFTTFSKTRREVN